MQDYIILGLALLGIAETIYLVIKRMQHKEAACIIGGSCRVVLSSKYNKTLGIHNDILGLLFYDAVAIIGILQLTTTTPSLQLPLLLVTITGALASLYFTYLQFFKIKSWCFWCLMSAINTWIILGLVLADSPFLT